MAVELDVRVVSEGTGGVWRFDGWRNFGGHDPAGDRLCRLGVIAYQAALVDARCAREATERRLRRQAAVARRINGLKDQVDGYFDRVDAELRADCGMGEDRQRPVWGARDALTGIRLGRV